MHHNRSAWKVNPPGLLPHSSAIHLGATFRIQYGKKVFNWTRDTAKKVCVATVFKRSICIHTFVINQSVLFSAIHVKALASNTTSLQGTKPTSSPEQSLPKKSSGSPTTSHIPVPSKSNSF